MAVNLRRLLKIVLCCVVLAFFRYSFLANAAEITTDKAVVFLLDASKSMNSNDNNRVAVDSIAQLSYSLPSDYLLGIAAYNNQVVCATEMSDSNHRSQALSEVSAVNYQGYTNAGEGLAKALELLNETTAIEKTIVILSDGEIDMKTPEETSASLALFNASVSSALEQDIRINVIGLGEEMTDPELNIFSAAAETGGSRIQIKNAEDISAAIEMILIEQLHIKKHTGALIDASGGTDNLTITIPYRHASKVRVLLTSTGAIENLIADFHGSDAKQFTGTYYALLEITNPTVEAVNIQVQAKAGSRIKADIIPEYEVEAVPEQLIEEYQVEQLTESAAAEGQSEEILTQTQQFVVHFADAANPNQQVFRDELFENIPILVHVDGEQFSIALNDGMLAFERTFSEAGTYPISFDFSDMPVNVLGGKSATLDAELVPIPAAAEPVEKDLRPYIIISIMAAVIVIAFLILLLRRPKKVVPLPAAQPHPKPESVSKYSYTGRLSVLITKTYSGHDIPPLSYNLFRLSSGREISLQKILEGCGVEEPFEGADKILFQPGARRSLILTNRSDCTILRNREIMLKGKSYSLPVNAKVDITFEDERSELTFQYRELKPGETGA